MPITLVNAMPYNYALGTQDVSIPPAVWVPEALPSHLPKVYTFAKKGPLTPQLVTGVNRANMYGEESFDERGKYATHQTAFSNVFTAAGNTQVVQRLVSDDAEKATLRVYIDVLPTRVQQYQRGSDGKYVRGQNGELIPTSTTIPGYRVMYVVEAITGNDFGQAGQSAGSQTDQTTSTQSVRYPLMDLRVSHHGDYGNDLGLRLWAPTVDSRGAQFDSRLVKDLKVYPFNFACIQRTNRRTTGRYVPAITGATSIQMVFKPEFLDTNNDQEMYVEDRFLSSWTDTEREGLPPLFGPFGELHVYQNTLDELLEDFVAAELPHINQFSDLDGDDDEMYRFNFISGVSSKNVPYESYQVAFDTTDPVVLTENSTLWAVGGEDGTMGEVEFDLLVREEAAKYSDPDHEYTSDTLGHPESIMYDSGYSILTKYELMKFIAVRKDTEVVMSTHDALGVTMTADQESSLAQAIFTRAQMYPESDLYGTPAMRCMIVGRSGRRHASRYRRRLPLSLEIAEKNARYMGAGDGRWKSEFNFELPPRKIISGFQDINVTFTPVGVRRADWEVGLNWVESFDHRRYMFPALKTTYDEDQSVLTSFFTVTAIVELQKIAARVWAKYTGQSKLTNEQLRERINEDITEWTTGRFDDRFIIVPDAQFTLADENRGYSWTLYINIGATNMKTVQVTTVRAYRREDLE